MDRTKKLKPKFKIDELSRIAQKTNDFFSKLQFQKAKYWIFELYSVTQLSQDTIPGSREKIYRRYITKLNKENGKANGKK